MKAAQRWGGWEARSDGAGLTLTQASASMSLGEQPHEAAELGDELSPVT